MNDEELQELCREWQSILRLQDWDLKIKFSRQFEIDGAEGRTQYQCNAKTANIQILDPIDHETNRAHPSDTEHTVVHELMHLHFAGIDRHEDDAARMLFEQGIDLAAEALVKLKRRAA